jgi:activating signal cointegrator 1
MGILSPNGVLLCAVLCWFVDDCEDGLRGDLGMRGLSLTQPWATAIALGLKRWETRSWPTSFRGEVAIHASKGFPKWAKEFAAEEGLSDLPLGHIVCVCEVTECRQTETAVLELSEQEIKWGDYYPGRYAFKLENVRPLARPLAAKGALGFWTVDEVLARAIRFRGLE